MKIKNVKLLTLVIGLLLVSCQTDSIVSSSGSNSEGIHVSGEGSVSSSPDIAYVQLGVQTFETQLDEAIATNNKLLASINKALQNAGVSKTDIITTQFNVYPQYDYEKDTREIIGYWVNNQLRMTCRDLTIIGYLLGTATDAGANTVNSIQFSIDDAKALHAKARELAIIDAQQKAETLANAAGVKLGHAVNIRESSSNYPVYARADFDAVGNSVPIESGQLDITIYVDVLFSINP